MTTRSSLPLAALCLAGVLACSSGGGGGATETAECDQAPNVAKRAALVASQPAIGVKTSSGKAARTFTTTFASVAGDPSVLCPVQLQFKDSSGDGALQPYEDWTRTPAARAADLAARMTDAEKRALMAHASLADSPTPGAPPSAATNAVVDAGIRFGRTAANGAQLNPRAAWANAIQERCEATALGIPFVLSSEPAHSSSNGRTKAKGFSQWPSELGMGATGDLALIRTYGQIVGQEYRVTGIRMALAPVANLATDPRWFGSQFTFGEDVTAVSAMVEEYVRGLQSTTGGVPLVAAVVGHFPGAGAAKGGFDARLAKSQATTYPGNHFDAHIGAFQGALGAGVAGVMSGFGIPEAGAWTGLSGLVNGATIEQVGASFNPTVIGTILRGHFAFGGLVVAPEGVLDDAGGATLGAPWGVQSATRAQRIARAVAAGVDQFVGVSDTTDLAAAALTTAQVDAAARRALAVAFGLGLFENPYVDPAQAPALCNTDFAYQTGLDAMNRGMVLLYNRQKPAGWLNHLGDGTQTGDKGNAGNGTLKVLPAPPGEPYVSAGCNYYVGGAFNLDYVRGVSTGYGAMTNDASSVTDSMTDEVVDVTYAATTLGISLADARMALADYVFVRIAAPYTLDPDSGFLAQALSSLTYAGNDPSWLDPLAAASTAITAWNAGAQAHGLPTSHAQIVVFVDSGRPSVVSELFSYGISGLYADWMGTMPDNVYADKVALDVAFGIVNGRGKLAAGLPASDAAAAAQQPDTAGDGQDATFLRGFGIDTNQF